VTAKKGLEKDAVIGDGLRLRRLCGELLPSYRPDVPAWLERGGHLGHGEHARRAEYGEAWHQAGMMERKQNVFDDFIAALECLCARSSHHPRGSGSWATRTAACWWRRDGAAADLMAVALPGVGLMDMLRFDQFTGGRYWTTEYGSATNPKQFPFLIKYSPRTTSRRAPAIPLR
jgi:prolyl oligopeptidase